MGFNDIYQAGFPSRSKYTYEKLKQINGTPELDKCIKNVFSPINFVEQMQNLDPLIESFNRYLIIENWEIIRNGKEILLEKADTNSINKILNSRPCDSELETFLKQEFKDIPITNIITEPTLQNILQRRLDETKLALQHKLYLSTIFLCGSILEGVLLSIEVQNPKLFNCANAAPKNKEGKIKHFPEWKLAESINVAYELGFINLAVKKYSHSLRDFRNYIHPYEEISNNFTADEETAKLSFQALRAAIFQINNKIIDLK